MAKITKLPALKIISGFKGTLDFYVCRGIACVRKWPRSPGHNRAPAVQAQWSTFTYAAKAWNSLPPDLRYWYNQMASNTGLSGRDMFTRSYIKGLFPYSLP